MEVYYILVLPVLGRPLCIEATLQILFKVLKKDQKSAMQKKVVYLDY